MCFFVFSISSWFILGKLYHSNNWSISSKLSISLAYTCFLYSLTIQCISVMSVATYFSMSNFIEFNPLPFILDGSGKRSITFAYPLKEPAFSFIHFSSVTQLCPAICNPMDYSTPAFPVHGIFQARILEWLALSFSRDLPNPGIEPGSLAL